MSIESITPKCETCGRTGSAIFQCPNHRLGNCEYVVQRKTRSSHWGIIVLGVFLGFWTAGLIGSLTHSRWPWLLPLAGLLIALGYWATSWEVVLHNARLHTTLKRRTVAGVQLSLTHNLSGVFMPIHLELSKPFTYPLSISALATLPDGLNPDKKQPGWRESVAIFRAAIIELLANQVIEVHHSQSHVFKKQQHSSSVLDNHIIVAAHNMPGTQSRGVLEGRILAAAADWSAQPGSQEWPEAPPIYDLVRKVYKADQSSPSMWLARIVANDAVARGLAQIKGPFWKKRIEWDEAHLRGLRQEQQSAEALSQRLAQMYPEFSARLDEQIEKAIKSRTESSSGCGCG